MKKLLFHVAFSPYSSVLFKLGIRPLEIYNMVYITGTEDKGEENTPKTGDDNSMAPWLLLALAAMTGTAAIVRRKDHDR